MAGRRRDVEGSGEYFIGLDRWILQDGNYTDFVVGERRQFALEFGYARSNRLKPCAPSQPHLTHAGRRTWYTMTGEVVADVPCDEDRAFVLECGLRIYKQYYLLTVDGGRPSVGQWLCGDILLGVDPFFAMDLLGADQRMPPLIYSWEILGIEVDVSPTVMIEAGHPDYAGPDEGPMLIRDPERERYASVERTDTWSEDEEMSGSYRLRCRLLDEEPERTMRLSGRRRPYGPL
ncbi:MAG: hypothetical protein WAW88_11655 [Nocardioides sp.]